MNAIESKKTIEFESEQELQSYLKIKKALGQNVPTGIAS